MMSHVIYEMEDKMVQSFVLHMQSCVFMVSRCSPATLGHQLLDI